MTTRRLANQGLYLLRLPVVIIVCCVIHHSSGIILEKNGLGIIGRPLNLRGTFQCIEVSLLTWLDCFFFFDALTCLMKYTI